MSVLVSESVTIVRDEGDGIELEVEVVLTDGRPQLYTVGDVGEDKAGKCHDLTEDEQRDAHDMALDLRDDRRMAYDEAREYDG